MNSSATVTASNSSSTGIYITVTYHINNFMHDAYHSTFARIVNDTREQTGIELPMHIEHYVVVLLAKHIDATDFLPKPTFAQALYSIRTSTDAKQLGDACLFTTGVFPSYKQKRYIVHIGASAYSSIRTELFETLSEHFDYVSNFINVTVNQAHSQYTL
jgi:hypothetical protein